MKARNLTGSAKHKGTVVGEAHNLVIFTNLKRAKTDAGKNRLWISVRHRQGDKCWRTAALRYSPYGFDVQFEEVQP